MCGLRNSRHFFTGGDTSISLFLLLLHPLPDTDAEEEEEEESGAVGTRSSANELQRLEEEDEAVGEKREKKRSIIHFRSLELREGGIEGATAHW